LGTKKPTNTIWLSVLIGFLRWSFSVSKSRGLYAHESSILSSGTNPKDNGFR